MARLVDWLFRDRTTGAIVIAQWPNLPLWLFAASAGLRWSVEALALAVPAWAVTALMVVSAASLAWWAIDEVLRGVNPWRRCLGGGVLLVLSWRLAAQV